MGEEDASVKDVGESIAVIITFCFTLITAIMIFSSGCFLWAMGGGTVLSTFVAFNLRDNT